MDKENDPLKVEALLGSRDTTQLYRREQHHREVHQEGTDLDQFLLNQEVEVAVDQTIVPSKHSKADSSSAKSGFASSTSRAIRMV